MANSNLDTASRDCFSCSDTEEVSIWTTWKRYRKRVRVSCKLSKGSYWMEAQLKRISNCHQDVWGPWPGHCQVRAKVHSSQRPTLFHDMEDDGQDWPVAPHCRGHWLQSPPVRAGGWDRQLGKNVSAVVETILHLILPFLWEGLDQSHDRVAQTPLKCHILTLKHGS